ncbi:hypothetical protein [Methanobrevibacter sp. V14]|nr:hypothetical protein [Methanobrevibacter sp. V14]
MVKFGQTRSLLGEYIHRIEKQLEIGDEIFWGKHFVKYYGTGFA